LKGAVSNRETPPGSSTAFLSPKVVSYSIGDVSEDEYSRVHRRGGRGERPIPFTHIKRWL